MDFIATVASYVVEHRRHLLLILPLLALIVGIRNKNIVDRKLLITYGVIWVFAELYGYLVLIPYSFMPKYLGYFDLPVLAYILMASFKGVGYFCFALFIVNFCYRTNFNNEPVSLFSFQGRISRMQYWIYMMIVSGFYMKLACEMYFYGGFEQFPFDFYRSEIAVISYSLLGFALVLLYMQLVLMAKRWHDHNHTGWVGMWFVLAYVFSLLTAIFTREIAIFIIPLLVGLYMFIKLSFIKGSSERNKYGNDPLLCHISNTQVSKVV